MATNYRLRTHPNRWGPGNVHATTMLHGDLFPMCMVGTKREETGVYAERVPRTTPVTCKNCLKIMEKIGANKV